MPDADLSPPPPPATSPTRRSCGRRSTACSPTPRRGAFTRNFTDQWLELRQIDATTPDKQLYPEFDEWLQVSMVRETREFFDELLRADLSVHVVHRLGLGDAERAAGRALRARGRGWPPARGRPAAPAGPAPPGSRRGGVLTHGSVLKVTANGTTTSPVLRGAWLLDRILGAPVPPPPANVPAVEPDIRGATTIRDQLAKHRSLGQCASCHRKMDPVGFALESFDVIGGWRTATGSSPRRSRPRCPARARART
jgi:hypothetical protein